MRAFHYFSKDVITHTLAKGKGMEEKTEKGKLLSELFFACFGGDTGNTFISLLTKWNTEKLRRNFNIKCAYKQSYNTHFAQDVISQLSRMEG